MGNIHIDNASAVDDEYITALEANTQSNLQLASSIDALTASFGQLVSGASQSDTTDSDSDGTVSSAGDDTATDGTESTDGDDSDTTDSDGAASSAGDDTDSDDSDS